MSATTAPLVWDFYREVSGASGLGSVLEYYDEESQSLYLSNGLKTRVALVEDGDWEDAEPGSEIALLSGEPALSAWDHALTGQLFGVGIGGEGELIVYRYLYAKELSDILSDGTTKPRNDSQIVQTNLTLANPGDDVVQGDSSLFNPGARLTVSVAMGDSALYPLATAFLDSVDFDALAETFPLSGRNAIGYRLAQQSFDSQRTFTGTGREVAIWILERAGITKYIVGPSDYSQEWTFEPDDTLLKGLGKLFEFFPGWGMVELPDGTVVIGYANLIAQYQQNSVYLFHGGTDVIRRKSQRSGDAAYSKVRVTGKAADGTELTPVEVSVSTHSHWAITKTKHVKAADGLSQAELQAYAEQLAAELANIGISEQFSGPMRPWLLVGDVASITYDGVESVDLGLVTSITHRYGRSGFFTDFAVDSGGVASAQTRDGTTYYTRSASVNGYNRQQDLADLIGAIRGKDGKTGAAAEITGVTSITQYLPVGAVPTVSVQTGGTAQDRSFVFVFGMPLQAEDIVLLDSVSAIKYLFQVVSGRPVLTPVDPATAVTAPVLEDAEAQLSYALGMAAGAVTLTETEDAPPTTAPTVLDPDTGLTYTIAADSGRLIFEEV